MFVNTYRARADVDPSEKSIETKRTSASRIMSSKMHAALSIHDQIFELLIVMKQALFKFFSIFIA